MADEATRTEDRPKRYKLTRKQFLRQAGGGIVVAGALGAALAALPSRRGARAKAAAPVVLPKGYRPPAMATIVLNVNGIERRITVDTRTTLASAIRNELGLTGTHVCCDRGECGACTVLMDNKAVYSCALLAVQAQGRKVVTIEGLVKGDKLDPVQQAFIEHEGYQCGFCTSGQIMAIKALLLANSNPTEADVRRAVSGNICRCGAYPGIIAAGLAAAKMARA